VLDARWRFSVYRMRKAILHLKKADPVLGAIIERVGPYRMKYREPAFETLVRSIVFQQLSGYAAKAIFQRLAGAVGEPVTPEGVLRLTRQKMRALGLSRQKIEYIRDLARRTRSGELDFEACRRLDDDEIIRRFTAVKGVGIWTVQMFLIFALRRPNVLPSGDLGVRNAVRKAYGLETMPKPSDILRIAENWRPYCSIASWYLWRSLENEPDL
jgi:DNA-3-methyladenine glycosylase II